MKLLLASVLLGVCTSLELQEADRTGGQFWYTVGTPTIPLQIGWASPARVYPNLFDHQSPLHPNTVDPQSAWEYPPHPNTVYLQSALEYPPQPKTVYLQSWEYPPHTETVDLQSALQFPLQPKASDPNTSTETYSGWPRNLARNPPTVFSDCLFSFYYCTDSELPGYPGNKAACEKRFEECESYVQIHSKPLNCSTQSISWSKPAENRSSCEELLSDGVTESGVYRIVVAEEPLYVYCDMEKDGGGWTVLQRRNMNNKRPNDYFNKTWTEYKYGFGSLEQDLWVGLEYWNNMTTSEPQQMLVTLQSSGNITVEVVINEIIIGDEQSKYSWSWSTVEAEGTMGDYLNVHHKGRRFTTLDDDNDGSSNNCAIEFGGGWWFKDSYCASVAVTLNPTSGQPGIKWNGSISHQSNSWESSEMKIRPMSRRYTRPSSRTTQ